MLFGRAWFFFVGILSLSWCSSSSGAKTYRILGIFGLDAPSHFRMFEAVCKSLAKRGHQVDVVSHFPSESAVENYRDLLVLNGTSVTFAGTMSVDSARHIHTEEVHWISGFFGNDVCKSTLQHEKMQAFIKTLHQQTPYDAIIVELFGIDCFMGIGHLLNIPMIGAVSSLEQVWMDHYLGNPSSNLAIVNHALLKNPENFDPHRFWDRMKNAVSGFYTAYRFFESTSVQTDIMRQTLGPDMPDIEQLRRSLDLVLINTHFSLFGPKPQIPNIIQVGGIHVETNDDDDDTMPQELRKWMDECDEGVVYFSLGSLVVIETLPRDIFHGILSSFAKLAPIRFLMKIAANSQINKEAKIPTNIKLVSWIPQIAVLRHKNTRAFITHGGLMGIMEALYSEVPMIGIPLFGDQATNVDLCTSKGMMVRLPFDQLGEENMDKALNAVLRNPKYKKAAIKVSKQFKDRPMKASDTAVFWVEYVIRNGKNTFKSQANQLYWWQLIFWDVYSFFLILAGMAVWTVRWILLKFLSKKPTSWKKGQ